MTDAYRAALLDVTSNAISNGAANLTQLIGVPVEFTNAAIVDGIPTPGEIGDQMLSVTVSFTEGFEGETALVLTEAEAKSIVLQMTAGMEIDPADLLGELGMSAIGEAMNQFVAGIGRGLGEIKGEFVNISTPTAKIWTKTENPHPPVDDTLVVGWDCRIGDTHGSLYWTVADRLADDLVQAVDPALVAPKEAARAVTDEQRESLLEITSAAIARGADNLTTLIGVPVAFDHGSFYDRTPRSGDVGQQMVTVSVHFTEGLVGETSLELTEDEAKRIVGLMVAGMDVPEEDYLAEIGMSALGEAMNQFVAGIGTGLAEMKGELVNISTPTVKLWTLQDGHAGGDADGFVIGWDGHIGDTAGSLYWTVAPELAEALVPPAPEPVTAAPEPAATVAAPPADAAPDAVPVPAVSGQTTQQLGRLADVNLDVTVELGRSQIPVRELLALDEGGVIRLARPVGEPVDLLVNGLRTARGEIVVVEGRLGLRVTELIG